MEVEVIFPSPAADFNFDSASTSPFISAPSSPHRFPSFFSSPSAVPFCWEEKPGVPKSHPNSSAASSNYGDAEDDLDGGIKEFAFNFSGNLDREPLPADELFDGGRIKPLRPPPRLQPENPPRSPRSPGKFIREAFSPRNRSRDFDPFAAAMEQTRREGGRPNGDERKRGRSKKSSRSLSPFRVSDLLFEHDPTHEPEKSPTSAFSSFWHRRWKIKDLLLFRSSSEGRAKDSPMRGPRQSDVTNGLGFRSTESAGSGSSRRRVGPAVSAHELHYTVNRQLSEEMRKRTILPYKHGWLGCLDFLPAAVHAQFPARAVITPTVSLSRD